MKRAESELQIGTRRCQNPSQSMVELATVSVFETDISLLASLDLILGRLELNLGEPRIFAPREVIGGLDHPLQDRFPESHGDRFVGLVSSEVVDLGRIVDPVVKFVIFVEAIDVGPLFVPARDLLVHESIDP